ncbi:MAG: TonB-dependent siderophore receptor [Pseudomonadota bacterium]
MTTRPLPSRLIDRPCPNGRDPLRLARAVGAICLLAAGTTRHLPLFALALTPSLPAAAADEARDDEARELDAVVVTATRQAYRGDFDAREVPQAELRIDATVLRDAGALDLDQALDLSASVARQNNFGGLWNSFAVRGFIGDENLPSNYLVNGFNAGRGFGGPRDLSGIESVDVLKGPRAALFGRGEPGGTINLVSKRPTFEHAGEVRIGAGRFDEWRADVDWTAPIGDAFAVRLVGFHADAESFRDTVDTLRQGASPSLAIRFSDATRLVYELEYSEQDIPFDRGVVAINGDLGALPIERFLGEPGDGPIRTEVLGHQVELQHDFSADWSALVGFTHRDTSLQGFSTEAELAVNRQRLFVDGRTLSRQRRFRDYDATYRVLRAEVTGRFDFAGMEHRLLFGADTDEFENDQVFLRARGPTLASNPTLAQSQAIDVFNPVYGRFPLPTPGPLTDRLETQESNGLFLQYHVGLTERLDLRAGLRYDDYEQTLDNRLNRTSLTQSVSRSSPQAGVVYEITPALSAYAAYGENFRPLSGAAFDGSPFEPNQSRSAEAGVKFDLLDGALSATASVFRLTQDNLLVADPVNAGFSIAAGEASSRGVEFDLSGQPAKGLTVWLSYAWIDAQLDNDVLDFNFALPLREGDRLLNIPEHALSVQVAKDLVALGRPLRIGSGVQYVGDRLGEAGTTFELPSYTVARAFAAWDVSEAVTLGAEIDNLFDETYYTNSFSRLWVRPGEPRTWRLTANWRF